MIGFGELDLDSARLARDLEVPLDPLSGFLALRTPNAATIDRELDRRWVTTDFRR